MEKPKNQLLVQILIFGIVFVIAFFGTRMLFFGSNADSELQQVSDEMNKTMPILVDSETRLDKSSVSGDTLQYHYTLVNVTKENPSRDLTEAKAFMTSNASKNLEQSAEMKLYREKSVPLQYIYNDKNGKLLFDFTVRHTEK